MPVDHLFVYGTLRRGSNNQFARMLADRAQFVATARVPGLLYDFGRYPGAVESDQPDRWVHGELHRFDDPQLLALLDEYEGSEFQRTRVSVSSTMDCWIYWYIRPAAARLIASGDWFQR